jgi:hypothetical protein
MNDDPKPEPKYSDPIRPLSDMPNPGRVQKVGSYIEVIAILLFAVFVLGVWLFV